MKNFETPIIDFLMIADEDILTASPNAPTVPPKEEEGGNLGGEIDWG